MNKYVFLLALVANPLSTILADPPMDFRILYAGHPGSDREKDFVGFLSKHFKEVQTADLEGLRDSQLGGFDVAILDYDGDGFKAPRPAITRKHDGPVLTVGVIGAFICDRLGLKSGYL